MVYILDQVRALEREMLRSLHLQGLDGMFQPNIGVVSAFAREVEHRADSALPSTQYPRHYCIEPQQDDAGHQYECSSAYAMHR